MTLLSRQAVLDAPELIYEDVEVPEWGGTIRVKAISGAERDRFEASVAERKGRKVRYNMENLRARLVQLAAIDEAGKLLFKRNDVAVLGQKSAAALNRVFEVARRLAGISEDDLEELEENLD